MIETAELKASAINACKGNCTEQRKPLDCILRFRTVLEKAISSIILTAGMGKVKEILEHWESSNLFDCRFADFYFEARRNNPVIDPEGYKDLLWFDYRLVHSGVV